MELKRRIIVKFNDESDFRKKHVGEAMVVMKVK